MNEPGGEPFVGESADGVIRRYSPARFRAAVARMRPHYQDDWQHWLTTPASERPATFVRILGRWQATRPRPMRRLRSGADEHPPPYIEDLLDAVVEPVGVFEHFRLGRSRLRVAHREALREIWRVFQRLRQDDSATCVAITKAAMLMTDGRVGPALDSRVRSALGLRHIPDADAWALVIEAASRDVAAFEAKHGRLQKVVHPAFSHLASGRLYDMALGPRPEEKP